jgi:cytochrome c biogenesis protein
VNEPINKQGAPAPLQQLWKQFSSMKFAIILLIVIAVVSVLSLFIGEFYPVKANMPGWQDFWQKELNISQPIFAILTFFRLHDPYHSWWYVSLLLLVAISLLACIIDRLPIVLRSMRWGPARGGGEIDQMAFAKSITLSAGFAEVRKRLPRGFRYLETQTDGEWRIIGKRGMFALLGPILAHAGLLLLAVGGVVVLGLGYTTRIAGVPGETVTDPAFDFSVRIDSFKIVYHDLGIGQYVLVDDRFLGRIIGREKGDRFLVETRTHEDEVQTLSCEADHLRNQFDIETDRGNIKSYISVLTVLSGEQEVFSKRVEVNHPLRYKGFRFYQSSFDPERPVVNAEIDSALVAITRPGDQSAGDSVYVSPYQPHPLPDGSELHLAQFVPDFRMDRGKAVSASANLRNPAILFEVRRGGEEVYHQWAFLRPDFPHMASEQAAFGFQALKLEGFHATVSYPTILEVNKSPGASLIWLGFVLCTLGLILTFYLQPLRLWVVIREKEGGRSEVHLGGSSSKNPDLFGRKFEHWANLLKGKKKG